jgi:hypothetical protein
LTENETTKTTRSDRKLDARRALDDSLVRLERGPDPLLEEGVDLLGRTTDEVLGVEELVKAREDALEVLVLLDTLDEVVLASLLLDDVAGLMRENTNLLVGLLAIAAGLDDGHDDVLCGHEGELLVDPTLDDLRVDNETLHDVLKRAEDNVGREEGLRNRDTTVRRVIERPLKPLNRVGHKRVLLEDHEVAGERADALRAHGVLWAPHDNEESAMYL